MTEGNYSDPRPRREQIAADLRAEIMSGYYEDQMPGIVALQTRFGGSNNTAQAALDVLEAEGWITRQHGKGTFVSKRERYAITATPYYDPNTSPFRYKVLDVSVLTAGAADPSDAVPADVAKLLKLELRQEAVRRKRLMILKGSGLPVELSFSYYRMDIAAGTDLVHSKLVPGGAPRVLIELGLPQTRFEDLVSTRPPTQDEVELLRLPQHVSVLRTLRTTYSGDTPVEVTAMTKGGHLFDLKYSKTVH